MIKVFVLACLGEYLVLLAGGISACFTFTKKKSLTVLLVVEALSPLAVLALTCVLLVLSWLHVYDGGFTIILVVSPIYHLRFETYADYHFCTQILLASMNMCAVRFALVRCVRFCAGRLAVPRSFSASARLDDDALELADQRPETSPSARFDDMSCPLPARGVHPEDSRILSEAVDKADSDVGID